MPQAPQAPTVTNKHPPGAAPGIVIDGARGEAPANGRGALPVVPLRIVPARGRSLKRWAVLATLGAIAMHAGFAALFVRLLDFRALPSPQDQWIAVEVVPEEPKAERPEPAPPPQAPGPVTPAQPPPSAGVPPPPFVAPPPEAAKAMMDTKPAEAAQPTPAPDATDAPTKPPPPAAPVLTSPQGSFAVPVASEAQEMAPAPPASQAPTSAAATLAAALPMDLSRVPSTFRSILSGAGAQASQAYKGLVYGRLQRAHHAMEEARAQHLKGQVMMSFRVGPDGRAMDLRIAASSGSPALDRLALAMVREAEPFPPPPQGADPQVNPVVAVGEE